MPFAVAAFTFGLGCIMLCADHTPDAKSYNSYWVEFAKIALFNLQLENFSLQFNLANLRYRIVQHDLDMAISKSNLQAQRAQIRYDANLAIQTLKEATVALDYLEDTGRLPASSINQKQLQVNKLSKALREFLEGF